MLIRTSKTTKIPITFQKSKNRLDPISWGFEGFSNKKVQNRKTRRYKSASLDGVLPEFADKKLLMERLWVSFYNACYESAEDAIRNQWVPIEHFEDFEPYLIWGITGKTILEALYRSEPMEGIQMALGFILTRTNCPPNHRELYENLMAAKEFISHLELTPQQKIDLKRVVLFGASEESSSKCDDIPVDMRVSYNRAAALIQNVSIQISQLQFFRQHFQDVFNLLIECCKT